MLMTLPLSHPTPRFHTAGLIDPGHAQRAEVEAFIAGIYAERYGARLRNFLPCLLTFRDVDGVLQAAVGVRRGQHGPLFVEQYLDHPAEAAIRLRLGRPVRRDELVEVGGFASRSPGDAREVIVQLTGLLHRAGVRWVLFVATRQLRNAFDRLRLSTDLLADARSEQLQGDASDWGTYYDAQPQVLFGDIAAGHAFLHRDLVADASMQPLAACRAMAG